jgi:hypothetical protein
MKENVVDINFVSKNSKPYLQFDFSGHLDEASATNAIEHWNEKMKARSSKISLIYNCAKMSGFDTNARRIWQDTMTLHKNQIDAIWVVCDNTFIRAAAKTMGLLTGFPIKVTKTINDIKD